MHLRTSKLFHAFCLTLKLMKLLAFAFRNFPSCLVYHASEYTKVFILFVFFLLCQHLGFNSWMYNKQYVLASLILLMNFSNAALPPPKPFWLLSLLEYHSNIIWNVTTHMCLFHMRPSRLLYVKKHRREEMECARERKADYLTKGRLIWKQDISLRFTAEVCQTQMRYAYKGNFIFKGDIISLYHFGHKAWRRKHLQFRLSLKALCNSEPFELTECLETESPIILRLFVKY